MANSNLIEDPGGFPYFFSLKGYVPLNNRKLVLRSHQRVSNRVN